ncbi:MAG: TonB-dependent receptor [Gammaproteobacteria bacterium]
MLATALFAQTMLFALPVAQADTPGPELNEVVVTGSRIPTGVLSSVSPVIVLERDDIERGKPDSLAQVLQALPINTGSALNTDVNNGGDGSARVDLRGLGPARTLVLLNGRRLPNGGIGADASVDLNSIPLSMIERIEVLTSGASAIYGADAVAGVINILTRSGFRGFEMEGQQSLASRGDGSVARAQLLAGAGDAAPGSAQVMLGVDYTRQTGVTLDRRGYSSEPLQILDESGTPEYLGGSSTAYGPVRVPSGNLLGLDPGRYSLIAGARGHSAEDYRPFTAADTFNFEPYNYSQTPNERTSAWLQGSMQFADRLTAFAEGLWSLRKSSQRLAPTPYGTDSDSAPELADGSSGIPANNYYNPFGADLALVRRRFVEIDDRGFDENVRLWRGVAGLRGIVGNWHWEASAGHSESTAVTRETGLISNQRLLPAIGPSGPDAAGKLVCGAPDVTGIVPSANIVAGCVPVNLFGGPGTITPEQLANLEVPLRDSGSNSQSIADVTAGGAWGSIAGQPVEWASGASYRREEGRYNFDPLRASGIAGSPLQADVPGGSFDTREVYAEMRAPLLHDVPLARALELSAGARYSDFSDFGSHTVGQGGLRWQPVAALSVRAIYAGVFRAPSIAELYQVQVRALDGTTLDPCGNDPTPRERTNCAAHGVPGGSYEQPIDEGFITLAGGNRLLGAERGSSFDTGIDVHWAGAVAGRASIDFFRTRLKGFISAAAASTLLTECADENMAAACAHIERNPDGTLQRVIVTEQNFGRAMVRGLDFSVNADAPTELGQFHAGLLTTYLARRDKQPFDGSLVIHEAGSFDSDSLRAYPHWRALANIGWHRGAWQLLYSLQYIGAFAEEVPLDDATAYHHTIPSVTYQDVECGYALGSTTQVSVGVSNATDRNPPFVDNNSAGNTDTATYRLLGRTFFAAVRVRFR